MIDLKERSKEKKNFSNRLTLVYLFFGILFSFFIYKTFSLQVSDYTEYEIASLQNKTREILIQPRRGIIYDRNGEIIVNNNPKYNLILNPSKIKDIEEHLSEIAEIINLSEKDILFVKENFKNKAKLNREIVLKQNLSQEEIAKFEARRYRFPSTFIGERYSRENTYSELFSHSIGYVGGMSDQNIDQILKDQDLNLGETIFKYSNGFIVGKTGIEKVYDKRLRGYFGKKIYEVDASGKLLNELEEIPAKDGEDLYTSLDLKSQKVAYKQLNNRRGAVVAVEIDTGAIVTYVSSPSFPINAIANGLSSDEFNQLANDKNKPFFDRAGQGRYSPASTIKPAIGLYGIENKIIDWKYTIDDPGFFVLPEDNRVYRGWKEGGHGKIDLMNAIIESSNTFFFSLAYKSEIDDLVDHLSYFGFGRNVCIDCFIPDNGLLPNPEWKINKLNFGWFKGDTVNMGVGQGYLSATPIQLAYYSAFLAKKGNLDRFSFIQNTSSAKKDIFISNNIKDEDWENIHKSMIGVIENPKGTARRLRNLKNYTVAAKSGTVELVSTETKEDYQTIREVEDQRDHAIIIAFAPIPNPKYAISVVIENGESGGSVAGPVAIEVLNSLIKNE